MRVRVCRDAQRVSLDHGARERRSHWAGKDLLATLLYWSSMTAPGVVATMRLASEMCESGESHAASVGVR